MKILITGMVCLLVYTLCVGNCFAGKDYNMSIGQADILSASVASLEKKISRTEAEDKLLELTKIVEENKQYLDENTLKDFNEAIYIVRILEERQGIKNTPIFNKLSNLLDRIK